jgi:hypothetical protein
MRWKRLSTQFKPEKMTTSSPSLARPDASPRQFSRMSTIDIDRGGDGSLLALPTTPKGDPCVICDLAVSGQSYNCPRCECVAHHTCVQIALDVGSGHGNGGGSGGGSAGGSASGSVIATGSNVSLVVSGSATRTPDEYSQSPRPWTRSKVVLGGETVGGWSKTFSFSFSFINVSFINS